MSTGYYIYLHVRLTDGQPFYIGKGSGKRAFVKRNRSVHWKNIVNKYGYDILLLEENLGEKEAHTLEKYWINRIGRLDLKLGTLVNFTDGGEGSSGKQVSDKVRKIVAQTNKTRMKSEIQKEVVGSRYRGKHGSFHNRSRAIVSITTGQVFGSISEAARTLNKAISTIHSQIGMHFQFVKP